MNELIAKQIDAHTRAYLQKLKKHMGALTDKARAADIILNSKSNKALIFEHIKNKLAQNATPRNEIMFDGLAPAFKIAALTISQSVLNEIKRDELQTFINSKKIN